jgi:hypothetical protein
MLPVNVWHVVKITAPCKRKRLFTCCLHSPALARAGLWGKWVLGELGDRQFLFLAHQCLPTLFVAV